MKVLLDECVDRRLARYFEGFSVRTNGDLLERAQARFDVLVTVDRNLSFQQHLPRFTIAVVLVSSTSNRLADLVSLVPEIRRVLPGAAKGAVTRVGL